MASVTVSKSKLVVKRTRLFWQLYLSYLLITFIILTAVTWYTSESLRYFFLEEAASDLQVRARLFKDQVMGYLDPLDREAIDLLCKRAGRDTATCITVILPSGKVIGDSVKDPKKMDNHADRPEFIMALRRPPGRSIRFSQTLKKDMMYVGIPVETGGHISAVIRASTPIDTIDIVIKKIQIKIAIGILAIAILAAVFSLFISRRITRPIEQIKEWADSIAHGEFQFRPPVTNSEEIAGLSEAMHQMAIELRERIGTVIQQRNEIEAVLSSMVEGVIAVDMEERVISMNHAAARILGVSPTEVRGRSIQEVARDTVFQQFVRDTLSSQGVLERDIVLSSNNEESLNGHGTSLCDAEGRQIGALIVLNDVTRLKKLEEIRREFVSNVSHEIKTPITAIKGFVETLQDGAIREPENAERFLEIIGRHADRLEAIVEDLLSLSKIEARAERQEVLLVKARLKDIIETAIQICEVKASAREIDVKLSCKEDITTKLNPPLLEQAIVNLIDNAIKYSSERKTVWIEVSQKEDEFVISVRDQGCGIERRHLGRIFERFYRVDKARSRRLGGTGLGLAIVKHIAQLHGGHVTVESIPGKGSTFSIHLPRPASS